MTQFVRPEESRAYIARPKEKWLSKNDIPDVTHHRSTYLHCMCVAIESLCEEGEDYPVVEDPIKREYWQIIYSKMFDYWQHKLDRTHKSWGIGHRTLIWLLMARIQFMLHRISRRFKHAHKASFVAERRIGVSDKPIRQLSVDEFWNAIVFLAATWNTFEYSDDVETYVYALFTQCGRLMWITSSSRRIFDNPRFCSPVDKEEHFGVDEEEVDPSRCYCVNGQFRLETERVFLHLLGELDQHRAFVSGGEDSVVNEAPSTTQPQELTKWLQGSLRIDAIREFVGGDFEAEVYERRAIIGEVERFSEKDPLNDPTAYNAISKLRPDVVDQMAERLDEEDVLGSLVNHLGVMCAGADAGADADASAPTESLTRNQLITRADMDADANALAIVAAGYQLDEAFLSEHIRFKDWFIAHTVPVTGTKSLYPVFVKVFHYWHVSFDKNVWMCKNSADAIECWIRLLCNSADAFEAISHVAPYRHVFYRLHKLLTGETAPTEAEHDNQRNRAVGLGDEDALMLPTSYRKRGHED